MGCGSNRGSGAICAGVARSARYFGRGEGYETFRRGAAESGPGAMHYQESATDSAR